MPAKRDDKSNKPDLSYLMEGMPLAREELNKRFKFGADKHGRKNHLTSLGTDSHDEWIERCRASLSRHYHDAQDGKLLDEDGLMNLSGVAWNALELIEYILTDRTRECKDHGGLL